MKIKLRKTWSILEESVLSDADEQKVAKALGRRCIDTVKEIVSTMTVEEAKGIIAEHKKRVAKP